MTIPNGSSSSSQDPEFNPLSPTSPTPIVTAPIVLTSSSSSSVLPTTTSNPVRDEANIVKTNQNSLSRGPRSSRVASMSITMPGGEKRFSGDEEKNANTNIHSGYQQKAQELSLRINELTARRTGVAGTSKAVENPEALAANLAKLDPDEMETNVHFSSPHDLAKQFISSLNDGLSSNQVATNRSEYGSNILTPAGDVSYILLFAKQLISGFSALLWIATIVIFISWQPLGSLNGLLPATVNVAVAALLLAVIFTSAVFNVWMEIGAINIVKSFSSIKPGAVRVRRDGKDLSLPAEELVVGDLVYIELGQRIPADMRVLDVHDLQVDNSALTGESEPITCSTRCTSANFMESSNMIFLGTACPQGSGLGLVVATGDQTVIGQINSLTQTSESFQTSLHAEIIHFVTIVACAALITGIIAVIVWAAWLYQDHSSFMPPAAIILNVISLIVAYVPEGLPIAVTLTLTIIAKRMYLQSVLVRNLSIIETFNSLSLIATDKTGTLTYNKMTITELAWGSKSVHTPPLLADPEKKKLGSAKLWKELDANITEDEAFQSLLLGAALCNNSSIQITADGGEDVLGDAADTALHHLLGEKFFINRNEYCQAYPRIKALPFNSKNKFMIACHQIYPCMSASTTPSLTPTNKVPKSAIVEVSCFLKGAPELVLERCSFIFMEDKNFKLEQVILTAELKKIILARQEALGRSGLRVIAMCRLNMSLEAFNRGFSSKDTSGELDGFPPHGYTFVGMFGLLDPPREEVAASVQKAHTAGIRVAMLTGDHSTTAFAIARQVNIIPNSIQDNQVERLKLAEDEFGRAVVQMIQDDKVIATHVLGQVVPLIKEKEAEKVRTDAEMHNPPTYVSKVNAYVKSHLVSKPIEPRIVPNITAAVITGSDLKLFDDYLWDWALSHKYLVFARTSPEQKLKIVGEAQKRHEIVAVTGDGVNDAPALKQADLGIAMQAGADVAREAGDIVLLDNNFASIIKSIETGRVVSDNLKKVCLYLMVGGTYCEMWPVMVNVFFGLPLPLGSFEMITISITIDILDALALVQEKPEAAIMTRPPIDRRTSHLVDWKVVVQAYLILGTITTFSAFLCFFWYLQSKGLHPDCLFFAFLWGNSDPYTCSYDSSVSISSSDQADWLNTAESVYFCSLIICNWFQMFSTRTRYSSILQHNPIYGPGQNLWLFVSMGTGIGIAVFILNVNWFNTTFGSAPVPIKYVSPAIGFGALLMLVDELRKWNVRTYPNGFLAKIAW